MRALRNLAAIALATGVALTVGATITPAAQATTLKPMTAQDAQARGWFVLVGAIEGGCTTFYLTSDNKNMILQRNNTPKEQCGATDYTSGGLAPNTMTVGKINGYKTNAPGWSGVQTGVGTYTAKQWNGILKKMVKPSPQSLTEIMSLSKPYLRK